MFITALLGLLKPRQNQFADKFSQLIVREESEMVVTSSDAELSDWGKETIVQADRMFTSQDKVDKRLLNILNLRYDHSFKPKKAIV